VLKSVAKVFIDTARRENDFLIRFGGDEFVLIMQGITQKEFVKKMNGCCFTIKTNYLKADSGEMVGVSTSIGCSSTLEDNLETYKDLSELADARLYRSKEKGKDCATGIEG
jgi:diguanylate cyclase (GGDEF)-like protein